MSTRATTSRWRLTNPRRARRQHFGGVAWSWRPTPPFRTAIYTERPWTKSLHPKTPRVRFFGASATTRGPSATSLTTLTCAVVEYCQVRQLRQHDFNVPVAMGQWRGCVQFAVRHGLWTRWADALGVPNLKVLYGDRPGPGRLSPTDGTTGRPHAQLRHAGICRRL